MIRDFARHESVLGRHFVSFVSLRAQSIFSENVFVYDHAKGSLHIVIGSIERKVSN